MDSKLIRDPTAAAGNPIDKKRFFKNTDGTYLM
jgi:hypothetical protein